MLKHLLAMALALASCPAMADEVRLHRFPAGHGDSIVFGSAGDLYTVFASQQSTVASRLIAE